MKLQSILSAIGLVLSVLMASTVNAAIVGVNFVGGQGSQPNGPPAGTGGAGAVSAAVATGAVPSLNWNNIVGGTGAATAVNTVNGCITALLASTRARRRCVR